MSDPFRLQRRRHRMRKRGANPTDRLFGRPKHRNCRWMRRAPKRMDYVLRERKYIALANRLLSAILGVNIPLLYQP